jgi:hypothetical protein
MQFQKGQSGNPLGRPLGARNKATIIAEMLLQGEVEAMTRLAIERAKAGDMTALRMCLDRAAPPCKHRTIAFELPPLESAADAASALVDIVDGFARMLEATILEQRIAKLEQAIAQPAHQIKQIGQDDQKDPIDMYNFGDAP